MINVLDKGYVRLVDAYGSDLTIANAARASFQKESIEFDEKDAKLVKFLGARKEGSPFRHVFASFEIKAPLFVARQWWKYVVGSDHTMDTAWNEASRRYITMEPEFYIPASDQWRSAPENKKQGSGDPIEIGKAFLLTDMLSDDVERGLKHYNHAMDIGVAPEQARLFLSAYSMYTVWRWTASLQAIGHFLSERLPHDAQKEIQDYAHAVHDLVLPHFPVALSALMGDS